MNPVSDAARKLSRNGISHLPIATDGSKKPALNSWTDRERQIPDDESIDRDYERNVGVAVVCGRVSGGLETIDIDETGLFTDFAARVEELEPGLIGKLTHVRTPRPGDHLHYRCSEIGRHQVLAQTYDEETGKPKVRIETRAEGNYAIIPPSPAACHPNNRAYEHIAGPPIHEVATITPYQRDVLHAVARTFGRVPRRVVDESPLPSPAWFSDGRRPGDDYNDRATWAEILESRGWHLERKRDDGCCEWKRPDKKTPGISATTGYCKSKIGDDLLFVFSSNAPPLEVGHGYTKFTAFALLDHGGDFRAAASALAKAGYGSPAQQFVTSGNSVWGSPSPLEANGKPPSFPIEALPPWLERFAADVAIATQVALDVPATLGLAACSAAVSQAVVRVRNGYLEPLNLYTVVVLPPGERKSANFALAMAPLEEREQELARAARPRIEEATTNLRILEKSLERAQQAVAKEEDPGRREALLERAREFAEEIQKARRNVPILPRLVADDATPEAVASLLAEHDGRIMVASAEGGIFEILAGRYSNGAPNIEVFLKGHSGDTIRVDRRQRAEYVQRPAITVALTVQPDVIRSLLRRPSFRGRGLLGRFLYVWPSSLLGLRNPNPPSLPETTLQNYRIGLRRLLEMQTTGLELVLTPDADDERIAFARMLEPRLGAEGDLGRITDWAGKLSGAILRVAGILHLAEHPKTERIAAQTIRRAIQVGHYLSAHAEHAFREMGADPAVEKACHLLAWVRSRQLTTFARRDAYRALHVRPDEVDAPLQLLIDHEWIRPQAGDRPGRRSSPYFDVNPLCHLCHKGQNPSEISPSVTTVTSGTSVSTLSDAATTDRGDDLDGIAVSLEPVGNRSNGSNGVLEPATWTEGEII